MNRRRFLVAAGAAAAAQALEPFLPVDYAAAIAKPVAALPVVAGEADLLLELDRVLELFWKETRLVPNVIWVDKGFVDRLNLATGAP